MGLVDSLMARWLGTMKDKQKHQQHNNNNNNNNNIIKIGKQLTEIVISSQKGINIISIKLIVCIFRNTKTR